MSMIAISRCTTKLRSKAKLAATKPDTSLQHGNRSPLKTHHVVRKKFLGRRGHAVAQAAGTPAKTSQPSGQPALQMLSKRCAMEEVDHIFKLFLRARSGVNLRPLVCRTPKCKNLRD